MNTKAILFGSIGTLVETSEIQRNAFNQAFDHAGLDWTWDPDEYKKLLAKSGGHHRIEEYAEQRGDEVDAAKLHSRKTEIYARMIVEDGLALRPGVQEVLDVAKSKGLKLAFVTSTSRTNIDAIFQSVDGVSADDFDFIGDASMISQPKPHPEIYKLALQRLGLKADECVAIEDTAVSMTAAEKAGIRCAAFPGVYSDRNDFNDGVVFAGNLADAL